MIATRITHFLFALGLVMTTLVGCHHDGPMEEAGEDLDEAVEEVTSGGED